MVPSHVKMARSAPGRVFVLMDARGEYLSYRRAEDGHIVTHHETRLARRYATMRGARIAGGLYEHHTGRKFEAKEI